MDENAKLTLEIKRVRNRCKELEDIEDKYNKIVVKFETAVEEVKFFKTELKRSENDNGALEQKLRALEKDTTENRKALEEKIKLSQLECQQLQETNENLLKDIECCKAINKELSDQTEELQIQSKKAQEDVMKNSEAIIMKLTEDNKELNDCLTSADEEVQQQTQKTEQIRKQMNETVAILEDTIQDLKKTIEVDQEEITNLTQKLADSQSKDDVVKMMLQNKNFREEAKKLKDNLILILKENEEIQMKNVELETRVGELVHLLEAANKKVLHLEENKEKNEQTIEELSTRVQNLEKDLLKLTIEHQELLEMKMDLEQTLEQLNFKHDQIDKEHRELTRQLIIILAEKDSLKNQLKAMDMAINCAADVEDQMKVALVSINRAGTKLLEEHQKAKQTIDEGFLRLDLDESFRSKK